MSISLQFHCPFIQVLQCCQWGSKIGTWFCSQVPNFIILVARCQARSHISLINSTVNYNTKHVIFNPIVFVIVCFLSKRKFPYLNAFTACWLHIVGATPLVDSGPSNLLIRWPTLLIRWPTLLFRDPLCWFGFPLCWCGSTQLEKWESESWHRPECWFGSCLESTFWSMPKHRIYKVGHIYNLHGPRINKVCHV